MHCFCRQTKWFQVNKSPFLCSIFEFCREHFLPDFSSLPNASSRKSLTFLLTVCHRKPLFSKVFFVDSTHSSLIFCYHTRKSHSPKTTDALQQTHILLCTRPTKATTEKRRLNTPDCSVIDLPRHADTSHSFTHPHSQPPSSQRAAEQTTPRSQPTRKSGGQRQIPQRLCARAGPLRK